MLKEILLKCERNQPVTEQEITYLLTRKSERERDAILEAARNIREEKFRNRVFLYGFVYFSTYCRNNCTFCYYRRDNEIPLRYRKEKADVIRTAQELRDAGVHLIDLTMGEDPRYVDAPEELAELVRGVKEATGLPIMVSPGRLGEEGLRLMRQAGADWYALYQETYNPQLYRRLRVGQDYGQRLLAKAQAREAGLLVEEGLLTGVGDTAADRAASLWAMRGLAPDQVRAMTFVPQEGAPLAGAREAGYGGEILAMAVMRLLFPEALIPASLDVEGLSGLKARLDAGANVVTSIIPPHRGYAGVANSVKDVDGGGRTVAGIQGTLHACGLENATAGEYQAWVERRRGRDAQCSGNAPVQTRFRSMKDARFTGGRKDLPPV